jgi:hypothetical protein
VQDPFNEKPVGNYSTQPQQSRNLQQQRSPQKPRNLKQQKQTQLQRKKQAIVSKQPSSILYSKESQEVAWYRKKLNLI